MTSHIQQQFSILSGSQCFENNFTIVQGDMCGNQNTSAMKSVEIDWEAPSCKGWENIETYSISLCSLPNETINTSISEFCDSIEDEEECAYRIYATNKCGETTLLANFTVGECHVVTKSNSPPTL